MCLDADRRKWANACKRILGGSLQYGKGFLKQKRKQLTPSLKVDSFGGPCLLCETLSPFAVVPLYCVWHHRLRLSLFLHQCHKQLTASCCVWKWYRQQGDNVDRRGAHLACCFPLGLQLGLRCRCCKANNYGRRKHHNHGNGACAL